MKRHMVEKNRILVFSPVFDSCGAKHPIKRDLYYTFQTLKAALGDSSPPPKGLRSSVRPMEHKSRGDSVR